MKSLLSFFLFLVFGLLKLAAKLRLLIPLLYALIMGTVFHEWAGAHETLAIAILLVLVTLSLASWVATAVKAVRGTS